MINLQSPIIINPPPFSDSSGRLMHPVPIVLSELKVSITDMQYQKKIFVKIEPIPHNIILYKDSEYDELGEWTKQQIYDKLLSMLGENPANFLRKLYPKTLEENPNGPGTILSKMIKNIGIVITNNCSCKQHALQMNEKGNQWCEDNIDTILGWMRAEAAKRHLPFIDSMAKIIINRAIKKSKKLLANEPVPDNDEDLDHG